MFVVWVCEGLFQTGRDQIDAYVCRSIMESDPLGGRLTIEQGAPAPPSGTTRWG